MNGNTPEGSDAGFEAAMAEALAKEASTPSTERTPDPVDRFFAAVGTGDEKAARGALKEAVRQADAEAKTMGKAADNELEKIQRTEPERAKTRANGRVFAAAAAAKLGIRAARQRVPARP